MSRRKAEVRKTPSGWVVTLAGGSVTRPMVTHREAVEYAHRATVSFRAYWGDRDPPMDPARRGILPTQPGGETPP